MKAKGLALQDALRVLQARIPHAAPNPGFMAQLELWGEMGCQIDEDHPGYKQYLLAKVSNICTDLNLATAEHPHVRGQTDQIHQA